MQPVSGVDLLESARQACVEVCLRAFNGANDGDVWMRCGGGARWRVGIVAVAELVSVKVLSGPIIGVLHLYVAHRTHDCDGQVPDKAYGGRDEGYRGRFIASVRRGGWANTIHVTHLSPSHQSSRVSRRGAGQDARCELMQSRKTSQKVASLKFRSRRRFTPHLCLVSTSLSFAFFARPRLYAPFTLLP